MASTIMGRYEYTQVRPAFPEMPHDNHGGGSVHCLLCGSDTEAYAHVPDRRPLRRCFSCGFLFSHPVNGKYDPVRLFTLAYAGLEDGAEMNDYYLKTTMRVDEAVARVPHSRLLNGAHREAIAVIRREFPEGCTVFDIGCGTGHFMHAMRGLKYTAFGLDVADSVVQLLRSEEFPMWHGTIDSVPAEWVNPQVCTSFLMLHHLTDPVGFIRSVRHKYPRALFIVAAHNDLGENGVGLRSPQGMPPRAYCYWGRAQLQLAMERGGYRPVVWPVRAQPSEGGPAMAMPLYATLRRRTPAVARRLLAFYYNTLPVWGWPGALRMRWRGFNKFVLAVGYSPPGPGAER